MTAREIIDIYISFFEKRGHKRIENASLVPQNDPTTLFINSGMQPLVPYLLGESHPQGKRLVDVQNCFRAQDIDEIGDNRHTTFFRMLGNWSLGDYFKKEQLPWFFEFLTKDLGLFAEKLYVTVFEGNKNVPRDEEAVTIWKELFTSVGLNPEERISYYGFDKNWWSRAGIPDKMPSGEPGGPSSEVFFDFDTPHNPQFGNKCHVNCDCGRYMEIGNSVFMQYIKQADGVLKELPKQNVDFGGGLERLLAAVENQQDIFQTNLLSPIIASIESATDKDYKNYNFHMRIITDHFVASTFIAANNVVSSNKEQGYVLRRLIRRGLDHFYQLEGKEVIPVLESIVEQYKETDSGLVEQYEKIKGVILEEEQIYKRTLSHARRFIEKRYQHVILKPKAEESRSFAASDAAQDDKKRIGDELKGVTEISAEDAFTLYTTHGLSPTQIKSLGYTFNDRTFAQKMEEHQKVSRAGAEQKFRGGLADTQEKTIMGHTATHLLHQALRDVLGNQVHQTGSNITTERLRFDFNFDRKLTDEEIQKVQDIINEKIKENLPVHFEMIPTKEAEEIGAIGLFKDTYGKKSKIYFIGPSTSRSTVSSDRIGSGQADSKRAYSVEFCGGPHVDFTGRLKRVKIIKQENIGNGQRRIYAVVNS